MAPPQAARADAWVLSASEHQPYRHRKLWGVRKPNRKWLGPSCPLPSFPLTQGLGWGRGQGPVGRGSSLGKPQGID